MIACYADFPQGALPVVGAKDAKQAQENLGALGWKLSSGEVVALEDAARMGGVAGVCASISHPKTTQINRF